MKKYILKKTLKERKAGQIVQLDENSFFTVYWKCKGIIQPLIIDAKKQALQSKKNEDQSKQAYQDTKCVKIAVKGIKKGSKKK